MITIHFRLFYRWLTAKRRLYMYWKYATDSHPGWNDNKQIRVSEMRLFPYVAFGPHMSGFVLYKKIT